MSSESKIDDGGPAFSCPGMTGLPNGDFICQERGMSLRQWYAGMALIGILGARNGFMVDVGTDNAAAWAFQIADKMIAEGKKQ